MKKNEIKKLYAMLNNERVKSIHDYKPRIHLDGIDLFPIDGLIIYNIDSLIKKIEKVIPYPSLYIDFELGYLRLH